MFDCGAKGTRTVLGMGSFDGRKYVRDDRFEEFPWITDGNHFFWVVCPPANYQKCPVCGFYSRVPENLCVECGEYLCGPFENKLPVIGFDGLEMDAYDPRIRRIQEAQEKDGWRGTEWRKKMGSLGMFEVPEKNKQFHPEAGYFWSNHAFGFDL